MISDKDIYTTANMLIKEHGEKAEEHAQQRMYELMDADDAKGASVWLSVMQAINDLLSKSGGSDTYWHQ